MRFVSCSGCKSSEEGVGNVEVLPGPEDIPGSPQETNAEVQNQFEEGKKPSQFAQKMSATALHQQPKWIDGYVGR